MTHRALRTAVDFFADNPHVRRAKAFRNRLIDDYFRARGQEHGRELAERLLAVAKEGLCVAVAFNTPWVIDMLTAAWSRYARGMVLVVADNSSDQTARKAIENVCRVRGVAYIALPKNPEWNPSRSHGCAMNWVYYNLIRHVRPAIFGFIDHDCFPVGDVDVSARMNGKAIYGRKKGGDETAWHLWAGLCFFRFAAVEGIELDFKPLRDFGLDTGGANWPPFYCRLSSEDVLVADETRIELRGHETRKLPLFDGRFLHIGGASYRGAFSNAEYRKLFTELIWRTYLDPSERLVGG